MNEATAAIITGINWSMDIECRPTSSLDELRVFLADYFDRLVKENFHKLISILYRIDISERKLRQLLHDKPDEGAGFLIAGMVIERQLEKMKLRKQFTQRGENTIDESEKW